MLTILDEYTHECHVLRADRALESSDVIEWINCLAVGKEIAACELKAGGVFQDVPVSGRLQSAWGGEVHPLLSPPVPGVGSRPRSAEGPDPRAGRWCVRRRPARAVRG